MADLPPPETLRKPTGDVVSVNSTQGLNTLSIGGKTYQILDVGYVCGNISCTVLSENTCLFNPAPYCAVCATCLHPEGAPPVPVPDWETCGVPAGTYGILVKFKTPWICHCLKMIGFQSLNVNAIQPVGTTPFCGSPSIPTPLFNFNPFPIAAGAAILGGSIALGIAASSSNGGGNSGGSGTNGINTSTSNGIATSVTLSDGTVVNIDKDGPGVPFRPGIDTDIDALPPHPSNTLTSFVSCEDDTPGGVKNKTDTNSDNCE